MRRVKVKDKYFIKYIDSEDIQDKVREIAERMNRAFEGEDVIFLCVLNGAFMFISDLMKKIQFDCQCTFIKLSSYEGTSSKGEVKKLLGINDDIENKTVIIVEDIIDTGITVENAIALLTPFKPKEIKVATLLFKPGKYEKKIKIEYTGFEIPDDFVVGYGLDYKGMGRNFNDIYKLVE